MAEKRLYLISYDFADRLPSHYKRVDKALKDCGAEPALRSQWMLRSERVTATTLMNRLTEILPDFRSDKDRLLVTLLRENEWDAINLIPDSETLQK